MRFLLGISLSWVRNSYRILGVLPSPLWGGVGGGGSAIPSQVAPSSSRRITPLPNPPPQGGREQTEFAACADSIPHEHAPETRRRAMPMNAPLRSFIAALLLLASGSLLVPGASAAEALRVGKAVPEAFSFVPLDIGMRKGLFANNGLDIESIAFTGDARMQQAMASDSLDIALGSGPAMAFIVKGAPIKGVAAMAGPPLLLAIVVRFTEIKDFHIHVIFAADKLIAARPQAVRGFLKGWFETIAFMRKNKAETVAIASEVTYKDAEINSRVYDELMPMFSDDGKFNASALATLAKSYVELQLLPQEPDMTALSTEAFLPK